MQFFRQALSFQLIALALIFSTVAELAAQPSSQARPTVTLDVFVADAREDELFSRKLQKLGELEWSAFFIHQAAEKQLKALAWTKRGRIFKSHDLSELCVKAGLTPTDCLGLDDASKLFNAGRFPKRPLSQAQIELAVKRTQHLLTVLAPKLTSTLREQPGISINMRSAPKPPKGYPSSYKRALQLAATRQQHAASAPHRLFYTQAIADLNLAASLGSQSSRAVFIAYTAVERLLKGRLMEFGYQPPQEHDLARLCMTLPDRDLNCSELSVLYNAYRALRYLDLGGPKVELPVVAELLQRWGKVLGARFYRTDPQTPF